MKKENLDKQMRDLGKLVSDVELEVAHFYIKVLAGHDINSPELYKVATDLLEKANKVVDYFEDNDENLNIETSKLGEKLDNIFKEDDPITNYVNAKIKHAEEESLDSLLDLLEAAAKAEAAQNKEEEKNMTALAEHIEKVEDAYYTEMNSIMDKIEKEYTGKKEFTEEDVEVLRVYLRNLPYNSGADIDELSDRAVVLGFKQLMYTQGKTK